LGVVAAVFHEYAQGQFALSFLLVFADYVVLGVLQLDECLRALLIALVLVTGQSQDALHAFESNFRLVLSQAHGSLHGRVPFAFVHLFLGQKQEVEGFCAPPGVVQPLVGECAHIGGYQGIKSLGDLGVDVSPRLQGLFHGAPFVGLHLVGRQNEDLLHNFPVNIAFRHVVTDFTEYFGAFSVFVGPAEQFDGFNLLVAFQQVVGLPVKQIADLEEVVFLSQLHRFVPLVQQDAAVHRGLGLIRFDLGLHGVFAQSMHLELLPDLLQNRVVFRQNVYELLESVEVVEFALRVDQLSVAVGGNVVLRSLVILHFV